VQVPEVKATHREAERVIAELGLRIVETYRSRHHTFVLETANGQRFRAQLSHNTSAPRFWENWRAQLRRAINERS
jgi:hypothetical protein